MTDHSLTEQVALVTGAGRRIGRDIALELARAGAHVVVHYRRSRREARQTAEEIHRLGVEAETYQADLTSAVQVRGLLAAVGKRFRRLDILVNNAGVFFPAPWDQLREKDWDRVVDTNLKGTFFCAQMGAKLMLKSRAAAAPERRGARGLPPGRIINISSLGGLQAWPNHMHYCASKAAVLMLTRCLAKALAPDILVNSVAPGSIELPGEAERFRKLLPAIPLARTGASQDIAAAVRFLATSAEYITGQVIAVDGGKSIL
jgi:3-oxoacyl-[acyl-carrier protein] reductase/pteridine reductase